MVVFEPFDECKTKDRKTCLDEQAGVAVVRQSTAQLADQGISVRIGRRSTVASYERSAISRALIHHDRSGNAACLEIEYDPDLLRDWVRGNERLSTEQSQFFRIVEQLTAARNALYAAQGRAATNDLATQAQILFTNDSTLTNTYHHVAGSKWNHMMEQTHIGYTTWDQPATNVMPTVQTITLASGPEMGVALEGSSSWWPNATTQAVLPELSPYQSNPNTYFEVFNRGQTSFDFTATSTAAWLTLTPAQGSVAKEQRVSVSVDWQSAPTGRTSAPVTITGPSGSSVVVQAVINNPASPTANEVKGFVETNGYISIEAEHYTSAVETSSVHWQLIPDLSRTLSAMTPFPVTATRQTPGGSSPHLEYSVYLFTSGEVEVTSYVSPTRNLRGSGTKYGVSFDDGEVQIIDVDASTTIDPDASTTGEDSTDPVWMQQVSDNVSMGVSTFTLGSTGAHTLKFWMVDPAVVLQKLVVETTGAAPSYLGPPESLLRQ